MKKLVIALFALSILVFAGIKGSLWYFTQDFVDQQIINAKPALQISYKDIKTSFTGSTTVLDVKVYIPSADENITIESIQFSTPDLVSLLTLSSQLKNNEIPESFTLIIKGAALDLQGNIMKTLDNPDIEPTPIEIFSTLACGEVHRIGSQSLSNMGYNAFIDDMVFQYQFDPRNHTIKYDIKNNIRDFIHLNIYGSLNKVNNITSLKNKTARLGDIALEIIDDSYIERKNRYCANKGKRKIDEYIKEHTQQVEEYLLSYGIDIEEGLLNAYKTSLEKPGSILFEADLSKLTGTTEIISFEPNDIIQFIRLKLFVNGKRINEISIDIDKNKLIETATNEDIEVETPEEVRKKRALIIKKYRPVSASNLRNFNGFRVKVTTRAGKHYKGKIKVGGEPGIYEIVSRLRSGTISYFVPINKITEAEVFN